MATESSDLSKVFPSNSLEALLEEYGVTPSDMVAPAPPTVVKANFDALMTEHYTVYDQRGEVISCRAHSGPLMFLSAGDPIPGDKYDNYAGYYVYTVAHPSKGKVVITHGIPKDESGSPVDSDVSRHLGKLSKGNLFQVAEFPTSAGYRVFRCIPVQAQK